MNPLLDFYNRLIDEHGSNDPKALNWQSVESQEKRFKALLEVGKLDNTSILDIGCGFGDLYGFLKRSVTDFTYKGIEVNGKMLESARTKYPDVEFTLVDIAQFDGPKFDYVLASGLLSFKTPKHKELYFGYIKKMFDISNKAMAFNMLNSKFHDDNERYAAYSVSEVYEFCSGMTDKIVIRQDYLPHDFTVYLYH